MKSKIRRIFVPIIACAAAFFGTSCYSEYGSVHTKRSAVVGGAVGAIGGALIGEHNDRELEGAAIGGVAGAIAGGILGSARDEAYHRGNYPTQRTHRTYSPAPPYQSYGSGYHSSRSGYRHYPSQHHHYYRPSYGRSGSHCR